ncbi:MAG: hypothetical protein LLG06_11395 [Desulfobacteraceae bacterium]|nr:hypothetical protein [Desulfobacteraceae bacterium]
MKLNPKGCTGESKKSALVLTNDPKNSYFSLFVMGKASTSRAASDH